MGGMCGWAFILFEIFAGEAGGTAADCSPSVASSFMRMRMIFTVGWYRYVDWKFTGPLQMIDCI